MCVCFSEWIPHELGHNFRVGSEVNRSKEQMGGGEEDVQAMAFMFCVFTYMNERREEEDDGWWVWALVGNQAQEKEKQNRGKKQRYGLGPIDLGFRFLFICNNNII